MNVKWVRTEAGISSRGAACPFCSANSRMWDQRGKAVTQAGCRHFVTYDSETLSMKFNRDGAAKEGNRDGILGR